jgi:hypothetical protein
MDQAEIEYGVTCASALGEPDVLEKLSPALLMDRIKDVVHKTTQVDGSEEVSYPQPDDWIDCVNGGHGRCNGDCDPEVHFVKTPGEFADLLAQSYYVLRNLRRQLRQSHLALLHEWLEPFMPRELVDIVARYYFDDDKPVPRPSQSPAS